MILTEYNEELHMKNERKIAIEEGYKIVVMIVVMIAAMIVDLEKQLMR